MSVYVVLLLWLCLMRKWNKILILFCCIFETYILVSVVDVWFWWTYFARILLRHYSKYIYCDIDSGFSSKWYNLIIPLCMGTCSGCVEDTGCCSGTSVGKHYFGPVGQPTGSLLTSIQKNCQSRVLVRVRTPPRESDKVRTPPRGLVRVRILPHGWQGRCKMPASRVSRPTGSM